MWGLNDGCALTGRHGRAHRHRPYPSPPNHAGAITSSHCTFDSPRQPRGVPLPHRGYTFDSAGLASVTQPTLGNSASEGGYPLGGCTFSPRTSLPYAANGLFVNDFSIRKLIKKVQCRWHRFSPGDFTQGRFRCAQSTLGYQKYNTDGVGSCAPFSQQTKPPTRNLPKRNRRGGACVPARTSAQRRFHAKNIRIVCGEFNDGCALVGRHGRAHRHRPYQSPSYFSTHPTQTK